MLCLEYGNRKSHKSLNLDWKKSSSRNQSNSITVNERITQAKYIKPHMITSAHDEASRTKAEKNLDIVIMVLNKSYE